MPPHSTTTYLVRLALVLIFFVGIMFTSNGTKAQDLIESFHLDLSDGLLQNTVTSIAEDKYGRIWIASPMGLNYFDGTKIHNVPHFEKSIQDIIMMDSCVIAVSVDAISCIDIHDFGNETFDYPVPYFYAVSTLPTGILLVQKFRQDSLFFDFHLKQVPIPAYASGKEWPIIRSSTLLETDQCKIIRSPSNVSWMNATDTLLVTHANSTTGIQYHKNRSFVCSEDGLHEIEVIDGHPIVRHHFQNHRALSILIDRNKNLWIGTADHGLLVVHSNLLENEFYNLVPNGNENIACWGSFEFEQRQFAITGEGIKELAIHDQPCALELLTENKTITSVCSSADFVLLGEGTKGILKYQDRKIESIYFNKEYALDNTVLQILANEKGYMACTKYSFVQFDQAGELINSTPYSEVGIGGYVMSIYDQGEYYIASAIAGAYKLNKKLEIIETLKTKSNDIISSSVTFQGLQYYTSLGGGLMIVQGNTLIPAAKGPQNLMEIENYADSVLWVTSTTSTYRVDGQLFRPFKRENGFPIPENSQNGMRNLGEGNFITCGINGAFKFNDQVVRKPVLSPIILLKNQGATVFPDQKLLIAAEAEAVNIQIQPLAILDKNLFKYTYQFNGDTIEFKAGDYVDLQVKPGQSKFIVSVWNQSTSQSIDHTWTIVRPIPFWLTLWFKIIVGLTILLIAVGLVGLVRFIQTRKILRKEQADRKVNDERLRISAELHDNIGARLTHIISSLDIELYKKKENTTQLETINSFARETMSQLRETIWAVSDRTIFFSEFVGRVEQYCVQCNTLAASEITFESGSYSDFELNPVQTINLYRIIQEGINNAVKYAEAQTIAVRISETPQFIEIRISDDGIGMDLHQPKYGTGLKGMQQRAGEAGVLLNLTSSLGEGTHIQLNISRK